jgi:hypothetical protein
MSHVAYGTTANADARRLAINLLDGGRLTAR